MCRYKRHSVGCTAVSRDISYVAARAMALIARFIDRLKKTAAHTKRPARIIMMIEKICESM
jgi:hypothetical protein